MAADLLAAAADDAVQRAVQTRAGGDCEGAVAMVMARLMHEQKLQFMWEEQTRTRLAQAMQQQKRVTAGQLATVASNTLGITVTAQEIEQLRLRARACIQAFVGQDMEICEGLGGLCIGGGDQDRVRLHTRDQVRDCVNALTSA